MPRKLPSLDGLSRRKEKKMSEARANMLSEAGERVAHRR